MAREVMCKIDMEENSKCKMCCTHCKKTCEYICIFTKRHLESCSNKIYRISKEKTKKLAEEAFELRNTLLQNNEPLSMGVYFEDFEFKLCNELGLEEQTNVVSLIDISSENNLASMEKALYMVINHYYNHISNSK